MEFTFILHLQQCLLLMTSAWSFLTILFTPEHAPLYVMPFLKTKLQLKSKRSSLLFHIGSLWLINVYLWFLITDFGSTYYNIVHRVILLSGLGVTMVWVWYHRLFFSLFAAWVAAGFNLLSIALLGGLTFCILWDHTIQPLSYLMLLMQNPVFFMYYILYQRGRQSYRQWKSPSHLRKQNQHQHQSIVIIGGGIAGLMCAWELKKKGYTRVKVLEANAQPGGCVMTYPPLPGHTTGYDLAALYLIPQNEMVRKLCQELNWRPELKRLPVNYIKGETIDARMARCSYGSLFYDLTVYLYYYLWGSPDLPLQVLFDHSHRDGVNRNVLLPWLTGFFGPQRMNVMPLTMCFNVADLHTYLYLLSLRSVSADQGWMIYYFEQGFQTLVNVWCQHPLMAEVVHCDHKVKRVTLEASSHKYTITLDDNIALQDIDTIIWAVPPRAVSSIQPEIYTQFYKEFLPIDWTVVLYETEEKTTTTTHRRHSSISLPSIQTWTDLCWQSNYRPEHPNTCLGIFNSTDLTEAQALQIFDQNIKKQGSHVVKHIHHVHTFEQAIWPADKRVVASKRLTQAQGVANHYYTGQAVCEGAVTMHSLKHAQQLVRKYF